MLRVNLSTGAVERVPLSEQFALQHIGGPGLCAALIADHTGEAPTALARENTLVLAPGPLTGLSLPGAARCHIMALSPQSGRIGGGSVGGAIGPAIRRAGYDAVMIAGRAADLSYLHLDEARVEIVPATDLAGSSARAVRGAIRRALGGDDYAIAAIGPAGERRDPTAIISSGRHHCAHGVGAVMGAKNLKAVAAAGSRGLPVADPARLAGAVERLAGMAQCPADCEAGCVFKRAGPTPSADEIGVDTGAAARRKQRTPEMALLDLLGLCYQPWLDTQGGIELAAECYRAVTGVERTLERLLDAGPPLQQPIDQ